MFPLLLLLQQQALCLALQAASFLDLLQHLLLLLKVQLMRVSALLELPLLLLPSLLLLLLQLDCSSQLKHSC